METVLPITVLDALSVVKNLVGKVFSQEEYHTGRDLWPVLYMPFNELLIIDDNRFFEVKLLAEFEYELRCLPGGLDCHMLTHD